PRVAFGGPGDDEAKTESGRFAPGDVRLVGGDVHAGEENGRSARKDERRVLTGRTLAPQEDHRRVQNGYRQERPAEPDQDHAGSPVHGSAVPGGGMDASFVAVPVDVDDGRRG